MAYVTVNYVRDHPWRDRNGFFALCALLAEYPVRKAT